MKAILSAVDKNFSSTMKSALGYTNNLKSTLSSGFGFGVLMGAGQQAFSVISNSAVGLTKDTISTSDAMQKLQQAMRFSGSSEAEIQRIAGATGTLKTYADKTVFSLNDVMSTFGALSANGIKDADKMTEAVGNAVAVFGGGAREFSSVGLAYSQAMASGALHAQDWNQILNASPQLAGGLRKELIKLNPAIGEDFKGAMEEGAITADLLGQAMNNIGMTDLAKEAATSVTTFEGAMGNLEATAQSGMMNLYDTFAKSAVIDAINGLNSKVESGFNWLTTTIPAAIKKATPYINILKNAGIELKEEFGPAIGAVGEEIGILLDSFNSAGNVSTFWSAVSSGTSVLKSVAGFMKEHADIIAKLIVSLPKLVVAYKGFKIVKTVAPFVGMFTGAIGGLAKMGLGKIGSKLFGVSKGQEAVGKSSGTSSKKMLASAKSFMMLGAGVFMVSAGFYLLAQSAVSLANAGPLAIGVMIGMVGAVAALGYGMVTAVNSMKGSAAKLKSVATVFMAVGASILMISAGFWLLSDAAIRLASAGPLAIATMAGMVVAVGALLIVAKAVAPALTAGAIGFIAFGAAVILAGAGMMILTTAAINLANAGPLAIACMVGMVAAIALLAVGAALLGPALTAGAIGFLAFGAAILLVGAGALLASVALTLVAGVLPVIVQYGLQGAIAIVALGAGMMVFAAGATLAGIASVVLGAGLVVVAAGLLLVGAAVMVAAVGVMLLATGAILLGSGLMIAGTAVTLLAAGLPLVGTGAMLATAGLTAMMAVSMVLGSSLLVLSAGMLTLGAGMVVASAGIVVFGAAMTVGVVGTLAMAASLKAVNSSMKSIASNAKTASSSIKSMVNGIDIVNAGLDALGSKAKSAVNKLISTFSGASGKAQSAATKMMDGFNSGITTGGAKAVASANAMSISIVAALRTAQSGAYSSGYYIGIGLGNGMMSTLGYVRSVAAQLAAAADEAIIAKAKIGSPSKVTTELGGWYGIGWVNGILSKVKDAKDAAKELMVMPDLPRHNDMELQFAGTGGMTLNDEYDYSSNYKIYLEVTSELDGRKVSKGTAKYDKDELEQIERRNRRRQGKR